MLSDELSIEIEEDDVEALEVYIDEGELTTNPLLTEQPEANDIMAGVYALLEQYKEMDANQVNKMQPDIVDMDSYAEYEEMEMLDPAQICPVEEPPENCVLVTGVSSEILISTLASMSRHYTLSSPDINCKYALAIENPEVPGSFIASDSTITVDCDLYNLLCQLKEIASIDFKFKKGERIYDGQDKQFITSLLLA